MDNLLVKFSLELVSAHSNEKWEYAWLFLEPCVETESWKVIIQLSRAPGTV